MTTNLTVFADKVVHVTMSGTMLQSQEIWQTGFYLGKAAGEADVPTQALADSIRDAWLTFWTNGQNGINQYYLFDQVKCARLQTNGKYDGSEVIVSNPVSATPGGAGGLPLPPQVSLVATLIGGSGKGYGGKGRMYLPGVSHSAGSTGHIGDLEAQTVCTNLAAFFQSIYTNAVTANIPINASRGSTIFLGAGNRNVPINGVRVGNVYDTQRRRRDALVEAYKVSGLIGP